MQFRPQTFDFTLYARQGEHGHEDGSVGITFKPTPSATKSDIHRIIDELITITRAMGSGAEPIEP